MIPCIHPSTYNVHDIKYKYLSLLYTFYFQVPPLSLISPSPSFLFLAVSTFFTQLQSLHIPFPPTIFSLLFVLLYCLYYLLLLYTLLNMSSTPSPHFSSLLVCFLSFLLVPAFVLSSSLLSLFSSSLVSLRCFCVYVVSPLLLLLGLLTLSRWLQRYTVNTTISLRHRMPAHGIVPFALLTTCTSLTKQTQSYFTFLIFLKKNLKVG